jgi:hypothetical protein
MQHQARNGINAHFFLTQTYSRRVRKIAEARLMVFGETLSITAVVAAAIGYDGRRRIT